VRFFASAAFVAVAFAGCAPDADRAWRAAQSRWDRRDPGAYAAWRALDPVTPTGAIAHQRLAAADIDYRRGIALLSEGDPEARPLLEAAARRAPLDPALYLALARAYRRRGLDERAAATYQKFLAQRPPAADAEAATRELSALHDDLGAPLAAPAEPGPSPWWALALAAFLPIAWLRRRRPAPLAALASEHPELQPAIAFLVGSLRHELFKHRILAVGDAVRGAAAGTLSDGERRFLLARLFGGEPLAVAWAGHVGAFIRVLGPRFDLVRRDPDFAAATRDIAAISAAEAGLARGDRSAAARVLVAQAHLVALDRTLGQLALRVQHSRVDAAFVDELVADVQRELGAHGVEVRVTPSASPIAVECYRFDLALVIRNLLRNAIVAAASGPRPARVALDFDTSLEPTGAELLRLRVRDTSPQTVPAPSDLLEARGLMLVHAALQRCDGSLTVEVGDGDFAKCVTARFFIALYAAAEAA
jgi:signal transduction histidine kinase